MRILAHRSDLLPGLLTLLTGVLVNLAPLALGSNRLLPWAYNSFMSGGLLLVTMAWALSVGPSERRVSLRNVTVPVLLYSLVLLWAFFQMLPYSPEGLANPIWLVAGAVDSSVGTRAISVNPDNSYLALMRLSTYASVFLCVFLLAGKPERARLLLWMFVFSACFYAVYGLVRFFCRLEQDTLVYDNGSERDRPVHQPEQRCNLFRTRARQRFGAGAERVGTDEF